LIDERDGRRTDVNLVSTEIIPVESVLAELDDGPVDGKRIGFVGGGADGVGVQDMADASLVGGGHGLGDAGVEAVQLLNVVRRAFHDVLGDPERPGDPVGISHGIGLLLLQPLDLLFSDAMIPWRVPILVSIAVVLSSKALSPRATTSSQCLSAAFSDKPLLSGNMGGGRATWAAVRARISSLPLPRRRYKLAVPS